MSTDKTNNRDESILSRSEPDPHEKKVYYSRFSSRILTKEEVKEQRKHERKLLKSYRICSSLTKLSAIYSKSAHSKSPPSSAQSDRSTTLRIKSEPAVVVIGFEAKIPDPNKTLPMTISTNLKSSL